MGEILHSTCNNGYSTFTPTGYEIMAPAVSGVSYKIHQIIVSHRKIAANGSTGGFCNFVDTRRRTMYLIRYYIVPSVASADQTVYTFPIPIETGVNTPIQFAWNGEPEDWNVQLVYEEIWK